MNKEKIPGLGKVALLQFSTFPRCCFPFFIDDIVEVEQRVKCRLDE